METVEKVYVVSYVCNGHDNGLYNEVAVYVDPQLAWRQFMSFYYGMVDEGQEPDVDLGELRNDLIERSKSVKVEYTDNYLDDYLISVAVEQLVKTRVKKVECWDFVEGEVEQ